MSQSAKTIIHTHQDAVQQLSAQVAKCHLEEVELFNDQKKAVIESSQKGKFSSIIPGLMIWQISQDSVYTRLILGTRRKYGKSNTYV